MATWSLCASKRICANVASPKDKVPPYKQEIEMFRKGEFDPQNLDRILGRL